MGNTEHADHFRLVETQINRSLDYSVVDSVALLEQKIDLKINPYSTLRVERLVCPAIALAKGERKGLHAFYNQVRQTLYRESTVAMRLSMSGCAVCRRHMHQTKYAIEEEIERQQKGSFGTCLLSASNEMRAMVMGGAGEQAMAWAAVFQRDTAGFALGITREGTTQLTLVWAYSMVVFGRREQACGGFKWREEEQGVVMRWWGETRKSG
ncbi:hypothetical protein K438DRAFT_1935093 [Mycena galopus ATCC 62051]|nr:hypothetical protein K438DRAFT_1935093 [Mycena galopus ATCC 62051]